MEFLYLIFSFNDLTANNASFRFGYDSESGKYGYILNEGGADTVIPFSSGGGELRRENVTFTVYPTTTSTVQTYTLTCSTLTNIVGISGITYPVSIDFRNGLKGCSFSGNQATIEFYLYGTASARDVTITFVGTTDTPVLDMTLLWTNETPTSAFAAQTVALDLSNYKSICIKYYLSTSLTTIYGYAFYPMGISTAVASSNKAYPTVVGVVYGNTGGMSGFHRDVTVTTSGVQFGQKGYASSGYGSGTTYTIPVEIYGIKAQIYPDNS